jgi:hypothetical protein
MGSVPLQLDDITERCNSTPFALVHDGRADWHLTGIGRVHSAKPECGSPPQVHRVIFGRRTSSRLAPLSGTECDARSSTSQVANDLTEP